jgi:hypothetical protein
MGGAHRKRAKEGHRGSKLIELGSYEGGAARGTHLDGLWVVGATRECCAVVGLLLLSSSMMVALDGGRLATKLGKIEVAHHVDGRGGVSLAWEGLWRCCHDRGMELGFW